MEEEKKVILNGATNPVNPGNNVAQKMSGGWIDGWVRGWMGVKAILRFSYSNKMFTILLPQNL